jgi:hypothetical protein
MVKVLAWVFVLGVLTWSSIGLASGGKAPLVPALPVATIGKAVWAPPWPWNALADCESGDGTGTPPYRVTWRYDGYHDGGYQFLPSTWRAAIRLVPGWQPSYAYRASPQVQTRVAKRWLRATSWEQWPTCARRIGLI